MKTATTIRHLGFEDLGSWAGVLERHGYRVDYRDAGLDDFAAIDPLAPELLILLGGPLGVYQAADYPYLATEIGLAKRRIEAGRPTLGVCLGSQVLAHALGADVIVAEEDEVGWAPLELTPEGLDSPLRHLRDVPVLHWHGDRFHLPEGTERLAATPACPNQAFRAGANLLAVQFHPEVSWPHLERWLIGHTRALQERDEDIPRLRAQSERNCAMLEPAAESLLTDWLEGLG